MDRAAISASPAVTTTVLASTAPDNPAVEAKGICPDQSLSRSPSTLFGHGWKAFLVWGPEIHISREVCGRSVLWPEFPVPLSLPP